MIRAGLVLWILHCAGPLMGVAAAQSVTGTVVVGAESRVLEGGNVLLLDRNQRVVAATRTSAIGGFALDAPTEGSYTLRILRVGFRPTDVAVQLTRNETRRVEVEAGSQPISSPNQLATVVVRGRKVDLPERLLPIYEAAKMRDALVFVAEDFALTNDYQHAFGNIPSVTVKPMGQIIFRNCERVQVYINGSRALAFKEDSLQQVLRRVAPADIALMEVYTHVSRLPAEYHADACAAVAIWTK